MTTTSYTPPKFSTLIDGGVEINCIKNPIECFEIEMRRTTHTHPATTPKSWVETTEYWDPTENSITIDWVSLNFEFKFLNNLVQNKKKFIIFT